MTIPLKPNPPLALPRFVILLRYSGKKALRLLLLMFAVSVVCFVLMKFSPIDPIEAYIGGEHASLPPEQIEHLREYWGLNDGFAVRYVKWIRGLLEGNMGTSIVYNQPVADVIAEKFSASLLLMGTSWALSGILGFSMGIIGALNRGKLVDKFIKLYCLTLASAPIFWVGILLLIVFSVWLGWFPIGLSAPIDATAAEATWGDRLYHLILPALTLSLTGVASIALHTRQKLIDVLDSDYALFAKARGAGKWLLFKRHGFKNILLPAITLQFGTIAELFGGSTLAEGIFSYPGLGKAVVEAGIRADLPLLVGIALFASAFVFAGNFIANLLYAAVDPRIREGARRI
ncbi:ABC transporter permease [Paenibacillus arenilitoris]|uniref:ABC transporter permease n=1 Tax=Paenibacillus arenilitoris TaxID=2772299 RepID=A0A927CKE3_9BACL|nr:ABC transporter permease [Paenibacillus arenilitoris]MBD2867295.1 ABC transporter permease [Paenibacillus arenilitoris]